MPSLWCRSRKIAQARSSSGLPSVDHLPVEHRGRPRAVEDDVADARVAPHQHACAGRRARSRAATPAPPRSSAAADRAPPTRGSARSRRAAGGTASRRAAGLSRKPKPAASGSRRWMLRHALDAAPPDRRALRRRDLGHPAARVVGRAVRRHAALDVVHDVERRAEDAAVALLEPAHARHRHVGLREELHRAELEAEVVLGEHLEARRLDAHDQPLAARLAALLAARARRAACRWRSPRTRARADRGPRCAARPADAARATPSGARDRAPGRAARAWARAHSSVGAGLRASLYGASQTMLPSTSKGGVGRFGGFGSPGSVVPQSWHSTFTQSGEPASIASTQSLIVGTPPVVSV